MLECSMHTSETCHPDLQDIIEQYRSQPDLLKLILTSKVEEDKRRAEEARLRAKELDLLHHQHKQQRTSIPYTPKHSALSHHRPPYSPPMARERSSSPADDHQERRNSAAVAMLAMGNQPPLLPPLQDNRSPLPATLSPPSSLSDAYPSPAHESYDLQQHRVEAIKPKRKREMQAITKIVETREFPYADGYFWKNNGNTIQKKTGCKSVYYKCSNSGKGCAVNKTVIARPHGEYTIKYRGHHLQECGNVECVHDL